MTHSDKKPQTLHKINENKWLFNYDVEETEEEFIYKSLIIKGEPSYEKIVSSIIREKYSLDEELAIQRQRFIKEEEFEEYFNFCESVKALVKIILN